MAEETKKNDFSLSWIKTGVISLGIAGIYSIILVILRTPQLNHLFSNQEIFKSALIIHVNLSVLVWLLSITAFWWGLSIYNVFFSNICSYTALLGAFLMGISPFVGESYPVMNNYIPILENFLFIIGLSLFGSILLIFACYNIFIYIFDTSSFGVSNFGTALKNLIKQGLLKFIGFSSACIFILVWVCFALSYIQLKNFIQFAPIDIEFYYELLFWSGGHILQYIYTQILIGAWLIFFSLWIGKNLRFQKFYYYLLILNFIFSSFGLLGHFSYEIIEPEFKEFYTNHMKYTGAIAPVLCLIIMIYEIYLEKKLGMTYIQAILFCSSLLFLAGGLIGAFISGLNVTIPAHYHGSIVGISIAYMGLAYYFSNNNNNYIKTQIYIIAGGQFLHITGLTLAGGYGVLRKLPGSEMQFSAKLALGLMGVGGLIAIIGGLMFVYICGKKLIFTN